MAIYFQFLLAAMSEKFIGILWLLGTVMHGTKVIAIQVCVSGTLITLCVCSENLSVKGLKL